ncbi:MAG: regulatory protein RecX [Verrucomicrobia bacterium]|nr:regulatory protein RecX [Verrucomicrobiota bacterium]
MDLENNVSGKDPADRNPAGSKPLDEQAAYLAALRLIAHRDRTLHEMRTRLAEKGFPPAAVDGAVQRLRRLGYLDDLTYAKRVIADVLTTRPASPRSIADRLRLKGVHPDVVREALAHAYPGELTEDMAYRAAVRRVARLRREDPIARRRKLAGFLTRRGFDYADVQKALRRVLGEIEEEEADADR